MRQAGGVPESILFVGADEYLAGILQYALAREGHMVQLARTGAAALQLAMGGPPAAAILEPPLPDMGGLALCARLRQEVAIPVLLLSDRASEEDVVAGFAHGADDYITMPFSVRVLMARLQRTLERARARDAEAGTGGRLLSVGRGVLHTERHQVLVGGALFQLTRTEGEILRLLVSHAGQVFSAERLLERVRGYDAEANASVVKTHISNLRGKLTAALADASLIETVPGAGYTFRDR